MQKLKWRLRINSQKSKVVHFRKNRSKISNFNFHLGENNLDYEASYKYLGVIFDENRDFKVNAENLAKSGGRALGSFISKINAIKSVGFRTYEKLFNNCVAPVLDYSSGVWGHKKHHCIEMVQNQALRYFLGVHQFTPLLAVQGESGWLSCNCRHKMNMLRLWNRLIYMENERITKLVFLWDRQQNISSNWSSQVKNTMESLNIENTYTNFTPCNLHNAEEKLRTNLETEWHNDIQSVPKLRTYILFKSSYTVEKYLTLDLPKPIRSKLAMFRCGVLPLRIETGRYRGEPVEDRICNLCDLNEIETEKHFLLHCPFFNNQRSHLFYKIGYDLTVSQNITNDSTLFVDLICNFPRQTAYFINELYNLRQIHLTKPSCS